jgi:ribosomal protein S18 acetylase RimI-like enzyme
MLPTAVKLTMSDPRPENADELSVTFLQSLPRELPGLIQKFCGRTLDTAAEKSSEATPDFPGIAVVEPGRMIAFSGYGIEPDGSVSLTPPQVFSREESATSNSVISAIVTAALGEARRLNGTCLRCLLPDQFDPSVRQQLIESGFEVVSTIGQWTRSVADPPAAFSAARATFATRTLDLNDQDAASDQLTSLLQRIVSESEDLVHMPRPDVRMMIDSWRKKHIAIFVAESDQCMIGVVALSRDQIAATRDLQSESENSADLPESILEYIGVDPAWRRQSVAVSLLAAILADSGSSKPPRGTPQQITAFVDRQNIAAVKWYQRMGFVATSVATLLVIGLSTVARPTVQREQ